VATSNRYITGKAYNAAKAFVKPSVNFNNQATILGLAPSSASIFWHFNYDDGYVYGARHGLGISVIDVSTPASANETDSATTGALPVRGSVVINGTLFTVSRGTTGELNSWDITNKSAIINSDTIASATKFSAIATDGTYAYVAGQQTGFYSFNVSNPAAMVQITEDTSGNIENQGVEYHNGYVYFANYHYGVRIFDTSLGVLGGVTNRDVAAPVYNGITLRAWECVAEDDYLYVSTNISNAQYAAGGGVERGLLVLPIDDPVNVTSASWIRAQIPAADQDVWNDQGDNPYIGITKLGNYVYMGAGHGGVFIWDVSDPTNPIYKGVKKSFTNSDSVYGVAAWRDNGKDYVVYGDGANSVVGSNQVSRL
jgi:hypothetical protein